MVSLISRILVGGSLTHLQKCSRCILQPQPTRLGYRWVNFILFNLSKGDGCKIFRMKVDRCLQWNNYPDESKVLQYFSCTLDTIRLYRMVLPMSWRWWTSLNCKITRSPDTLWVLLTRFASMMRTAWESTLIGYQ